MDSLIIIALALSWLAILILGWVIYLLIRQYGRALLAQDELTNRLRAVEQELDELTRRVTAVNTNIPVQSIAQPVSGLALGSRAPSFRLPDLRGHERTLDEFLDRPLLVIFFNPTCSFCAKMAPQLGSFPNERARVLVVSRGDLKENQRLAKEYAWQCDVVLDRGWEVTNAFQSTGTPMGYLLDTQGKITSPLTVGAEALWQLYETIPSRQTQTPTEDLTAERLREKQQAVETRARAAGIGVRESRLNRDGLPAGTRAPNFTLPDLQGISHSLKEFRGSRVLLLFSAPDCGPCMTLAPELEPLSQQYLKDNLRLVMISRGDLEANRAKAKEFGFTFPVLMQRNWEVSKEYALFATPIAYLIDENGIIVKDVAIGANAIRQLV